MKILRASVVIACFFSFPIAAVEAEEFVFNFNDSVPPEFTVGGNGTFSQTLNSSIVYSGAKSLQLTTSRGSGPNYAFTTLNLGKSIQRISFAIYDMFAGASPFYMYFGITDSNATPTGILAWQDAALSDDVLIYGGSNMVPTARTVGWHTVVVEFTQNIATYTYDGKLLGTYTSTAPLNVTSVGWTVDSVGSGTHSIYIDDVVVQTVPDPVYEVSLTLKSSTDMINWTPVLTNVIETLNPREFYKTDIAVQLKEPTPTP